MCQSIREPYRDWAEGHINRIKGILNSSRAEHTQAVKDRIASVEQMKDVVSVTENLFALSKVRSSRMASTHVLFTSHIYEHRRPRSSRRRRSFSSRRLRLQPR